MPNKDTDEAMLKILKINKEIDEIENEGFNVHLQNKKAANKAQFSQIIIENTHYICNRHPDYLTTGEFSLLFKLCSLTTKASNLITVYENRTGYGYKNTFQIADKTQIANFLNKSRPNISNKINSLIDKGIIYEDEEKCILTEEDKRKVNAVPLFINPEINFKGNRNYILGNVARLVKEKNVLEKNDITLPWKVWINPNDKFGKLIRRETFVKKDK